MTTEMFGTKNFEIIYRNDVEHCICLTRALWKRACSARRGYLLSPDRVHVTRFGAIYFGREVLLHSPYGEILTKANAAAANRVN